MAAGLDPLPVGKQFKEWSDNGVSGLRLRVTEKGMGERLGFKAWITRLKPISRTQVTLGQYQPAPMSLGPCDALNDDVFVIIILCSAG
jgi:hypothetical protein